MVDSLTGVSLAHIDPGDPEMAKGLTVRSLQAFAGAFVVAGFAALAADEIGASSAVLAHITSPAASTQVTPVVGDLPDVAIEAADGTHTTFAATDGHVRIATMFYSHCPGVCPMTIDALRGIDRQLTPEQQARLSFVLLTLDPTRDSPPALRALARERGIDSSRWLLGRTSAGDARAFASAAHLQYRPLADGSIDHSATLVLVNARGRLLARASDAEDTAEFVAAVRRAVGGQ